nr:cytochrome c [Providencia rettgeri]
MMGKLKINSLLLIIGLCSIAAKADNNFNNGQQLVAAGDCISCHTAKDGAPFAGGLKMNTPIGAVYSSNITPDKTFGIGNYSYDDFVKAVREGVAKDGRNLYPAMPYTSYAKVTDQDMRMIYDYFMTQVKPVKQANLESDIPWLISMRWPLAVWNEIYLDNSIYQADNSKSEQWNRGAYLVQGLAHCGACHTSRGIGFAEKALDQSDQTYLTGALIDNWYAPDLTENAISGLGNWSKQDIIQFLKTGHNDKNAAFGSMSDVIKNSTQYLSDEDLTSIAVYLKSLTSTSKHSASSTTSNTTTSLVAGDMSQPGAQEYMDNCSACHRIDGQGYTKTFPSLAGSPVVLSEKPDSLIRIVLNGSQVPVTQDAPTGLTMPDFAWRLDDLQMANLLTFIRSSWGNNAEKVTVSDVKSVRDATTTKGKN